MAVPTPAERLLADLNAAQHEAVTSSAAPLCILAGAGSGKTRVLTRRIAHRVVTGTADAPHVLALTFTRKAAGELTGRLRAAGVRDSVVAGTFHAVAYAQLRRRWADRGERAPALLDRKVRLLAEIVGRPSSGSGSGPQLQLADVAAEIEWAKARLVPASQYEVEADRAGRTPPAGAAQLAAWYEQYEARKRRKGLIDFDDLLGLCARALDTDEEFAATQRWRFRHLFVDEFQDVNPVQFRLLKGWLGGRADLCVVGDPNQAIYSWNGADPRLLQGFERLFPGATTIRLDDNYRSTPQVLAVAGAVLGGSNGGGLRAHRPDGPLPVVRTYATDAAEAHGIAAAIRRHHGPARPWSHHAVLVRTNAQAVEFEKAFKAAQIPFRVRGGGGLLRQPEVKEALAMLLASPARVGFSARVTELEVLSRSEPVDDRRAHLEALVALAREYALLDTGASVPGFSAWLRATVQQDEPEEGGDAVDVVTFHRAKGLEWPTVFVAGLERGLVPIGRAETMAAEDEERRLLYVALTRAHEELHCSWAERRTFGEKSIARAPSPWLATIEAAVRALDAEGPAGDWRAYLEGERTRLHAMDGGRAGARPDPDVLAALKSWRARAARAAAVPPYVIFHDTTLAALAERRPADRAELLTVPGMGPVKAERYGHDLLALVAEHRKSA